MAAPLISVIALILLRHPARAAPPAGWITCGGLPDAYNRTACPLATQSCAKQAWEPAEGAWGCCPFPGGVSCGDYTCCPAGTRCQNSGSGWGVVSQCVKSSSSSNGGMIAVEGDQVCKTGPPLPLSTTQKNVLIIGDSVSIGYTPFVANIMSHSGVLVQHSPWGGDGGAEETQYGYRCIDNLLRAPDGTPLSPNVVMFNWGLHNSLSGNKTSGYVPGQSGSPDDYAPYLRKIVAFLEAAPALAQTKLLFAITTPMLCNADIDAIQVDLNGQAQAIMQAAGIPTVDLHAAVVGKCGAVPQPSCFGSEGCYCPHCPANGGAGYLWLANATIVPAIRALL